MQASVVNDLLVLFDSLKCLLELGSVVLYNLWALTSYISALRDNVIDSNPELVKQYKEALMRSISVEEPELPVVRDHYERFSVDRIMATQ